MRPLIGIPCRIGTRVDKDITTNYNNKAYTDAVEHAGGVPILIPILQDLDTLSTIFSRIDGLLLSGGIDLHPNHYHEDSHPLLGKTHSHMDDLEISLARMAFENDLPTLGICRGQQLINVALGGSLYQDLGTQYPDSLHHGNWDLPRNTLIHQVQIQEDSRLHNILGVSEISVNSLHHQAIKIPGQGVYISGYAEDGVAECIEIPNHPFMLAVQSHPEELYSDYPLWMNLFHNFIEACTYYMHHDSLDTRTEIRASA